MNTLWASQLALVVKNLLANAGDIRDTRDTSSIPGSGRSPEEGKGYPFQYSGLENSRDYTVTPKNKQRLKKEN